MSPIDTVAPSPLTASQARALALMEVDVYLRRRLPRSLAAAGVPSGETSAAGWSEADCALPLARAVARAGGLSDAAAWSAAWRQAGLPLPDLADLRVSAAAKRALWLQMRSRR
jgi:hypothetical protein